MVTDTFWFKQDLSTFSGDIILVRFQSLYLSHWHHPESQNLIPQVLLWLPKCNMKQPNTLNMRISDQMVPVRHVLTSWFQAISDWEHESRKWQLKFDQIVTEGYSVINYLQDGDGGSEKYFDRTNSILEYLVFGVVQSQEKPSNHTIFHVRITSYIY